MDSMEGYDFRRRYAGMLAIRAKAFIEKHRLDPRKQQDFDEAITFVFADSISGLTSPDMELRSEVEMLVARLFGRAG